MIHGRADAIVWLRSDFTRLSYSSGSAPIHLIVDGVNELRMGDQQKMNQAVDDAKKAWAENRSEADRFKKELAARDAHHARRRRGSGAILLPSGR